MAKLGLKEVILGAALALQPGQASSTDKPKTPEADIASQCHQEGAKTRQAIHDLLDSLDFYIDSWAFWPERAGKKAEGDCIDREIPEHCAAVGNEAYLKVFWAFEFETSGTRAAAARAAQAKEEKCTREMSAKLKK